MSARTCETPGCDKPAGLSCPKCTKLGLPPSFFCSQSCFKGYWGTHKRIHKLAKASVAASMVASEFDESTGFAGFKFSGPLRPVLPREPRRMVPAHIPRPDYYLDGIPKSEEAERNSTKIPVCTEEEIETMREVCKLGREILDLAGRMIDVGVTCDDIDRACHEAIIAADAYPSPFNYRGFPKSVCTSVNEVVCHGIPDGYALKDGDIVNVDVSVFKHGMHADLNETFLVGDVDEAGRNLVQTTYDSLEAAIAMCRPGVRYRDLGNEITKVAKAGGCTVNRTYCGHGVGKLFHGNPSIMHYKNNRAIGVMKPGHIFTIEPMLQEGTSEDMMWPDQWTCTTRDGKRSAQFEHTLLITEDGVEVLTRRSVGSYIDRKAEPAGASDQAAA